MGRRVRTLTGLWALAELVVFVLVAMWIGVGWTILATLATSAVGLGLLGRQGTRALTELRERAQSRQPAGRALGDAGLVAVGGLLMLLPGFLGDLVGLLCLLPVTRPVPRGLLSRLFAGRIPPGLRGSVRVRSARVEQDGVRITDTGVSWPAEEPRIIEGQVLEGEALEGEVLHGKGTDSPA